MTPEKQAAIKACIEDGWPIIQIQTTHKVGRLTIRRMFPDYPGMSKPEAARLGAYAKRANERMRRVAP